MILSAAMMFRYDLGRPEEALFLETAVDAVIQKGYATADIAREGKTTLVGCKEMGQRVKAELVEILEKAGKDGVVGASAAVGTTAR